MKTDDIYNAWAPPESTWARWAKPVLFAHAGKEARPVADVPQESGDVTASPQRFQAFAPADGLTAMIVDLPDETGVRAGMALAHAGYRPVPLYNSVPESNAGGSAAGGIVAVPMARILAALDAFADELRELALPAEAPPAFLLDSRRRRGGPLPPGAFDNRSISLPTDFPSANFLLASGVQRIVVIAEDGAEIQNDLAHTLRRWQQAGLKIFRCSDRANAAVQPITIARPPYFRHLWYGLLATVGLRRSALGGFGGFLPLPSTG
ncbi:MAG TPA: hypothetical protein VFE47_06290 [Tepidisphaeraceae bacterium]|jgi:hypothetical protein|nr:hypothetical protein [Tepidisphaeraceae bacterium]